MWTKGSARRCLISSGSRVVRWSDQDGLAGLLAAYHLRTEAEKGNVVAGVHELPARYRAEILDPRAAFARDTVLVALDDHTAVGCVVVTAAVGGRVEIKRLWTDPACRGRGVATSLLRAALAHAGRSTVRLSVWDWRAGAVALYERFGFAVVEPWDERDRLVCMERVVSPL
jgi:ribosomal protein S18 acetylase RimI-like enzyme